MAPVFLAGIQRARHPRLMTLAMVVLTGVYIPLIAHMNKSMIAIMRIPALVVGLAVGRAALDGKDSDPPREWVTGLLCLVALPVLGRVAANALRRLGFRAFQNVVHLRLIRSLEAPLLATLITYSLECLDRLKLHWVCTALEHIGRYSLEFFLSHIIVCDLLRHFTQLANLPFLVIVLAGGYALARAIRWAEPWLLMLWDRLAAAVIKPASP